MNRLAERIEKSWYQDRGWNVWLLPLSGLFFILSHVRRLWLTKINKAIKNSSVPVVVIGNINIGGTGKTPLTCRLVELLSARGVKVGIISRGYGSNAPYYPYCLVKGESASVVGDEPKLLRDRLECPVVIGPDRNAAISLLSAEGVDLILTDDGLQHYKMARDYEIVVLDAARKLGSGWLLPAGPLREGAWRLKNVDVVILNGGVVGGDMQITPTAWVNAQTCERQSLEFFAGEKLHALAGIGNPQRFFATLDELGVKHQDHVFADHHGFVESDLKLKDQYSSQIVMTEKDWVKCAEFSDKSMWYLEVSAQLNQQLETKLMNDLMSLVNTGQCKLVNDNNVRKL